MRIDPTDYERPELSEEDARAFLEDQAAICKYLLEHDGPAFVETDAIDVQAAQFHIATCRDHKHSPVFL